MMYPSAKIDFNRIKNIILVLVIVASIVATLADHNILTNIANQARQVTVLAIGLLICEISFVAGALIMAASVGVELSGGSRIRGFVAHIRAVRRNIKDIAASALKSRLFGLGFWLNFGGAVGTSLILAFTVIKFAPITGFGLLLVVILDLVATFSWRIPLHKMRRSN